MKRLRAAIAICLVIVMAFALTGCQQQEYKPELGSAQVQPPTIGEDGVLRVGVNTNKSPLAGMGNDKIIGIDVDIAAALADELGLKVSIVDVGNSPDAALEDGTVDIVMGIDSAESLEGVWLSSQYLPTGVALFALEGSNAKVPTADSKPSIAAQVSSKSAWAVTNAFGEEALSSANDLTSAVNQLQSGQVDYLASDAVIGMYAANRTGANVEIVALIDSASGYCVAISESNTELQKTITDSLQNLISNGTVGVIEQKWLGAELDLDSVAQAEVKKQQTDNAEEPAAGANSSSSSSSASSSSSSSSAA
ncbi:ABC transporter substrate-binding protein [Adlercreutzia sp. ZJ154]|uniref:substrate-binding periplasmic protein n=1 Tax=Adlercreutzia sp. ZJ154 TaxID=2709790 RepID=UPI0013EB53B1|nr:transporter substrate-binding domain-containing protein [Adlercreutzia sp. ZJ154]